ncbi:MAG: hypothetical protein KF799_10125 [Bdellovibrionales bacterium]|nr:hypothetical protein [Bdellovibrionales bacterium]
MNRSGLNQDRVFLVPPPDKIEYMTFGFRQSVADTFWLRWIQDADTCYAYLDVVKMNPSPQGFMDGSVDDRYYNPRNKHCDNSWGFKMLDTVTKVDERFKMPYLAGTMALSVLVEDFEGASAIFERGLTVYPDDWVINYRAAYHFLFDKQNLTRAAQLLEHAANHGGPDWLRSLAARLYTKTGQLELGLSSLISFRKSYPPGHPGLIELDKRISVLESELKKEKTK